MSSSYSSSSRDSISVFIRIRGHRDFDKEETEIAARADPAAAASGKEILLKREPSMRASGTQQEQRLSFDRVFGGNASQEEVYDAVGKRAIDAVFDSLNACIFAYGQTSSGKTYTMMSPAAPVEQQLNNENDGDAASPVALSTTDELRGITPRALEDLFGRISEKQEGGEREAEVQLGVMELYNEQLFDLLDSGEEQQQQQQLRIREDRENGVFVEGLKQRRLLNAQDGLGLLDYANKKKHISSTLMNKTSSRGSTIAQLSVKLIDNVDKSTSCTKLSLVDLAGSERASRTGAVGERLKEAAAINLSLSTLANVINKLTDDSGRSKSAGMTHVPYRDSKLTRILQSSIGGDSVTQLVCCVSPFMADSSESLSTLQFAQRAKLVKNTPCAHKEITDADALKRELGRRDDEIAGLKAKIRLLEAKLMLLSTASASGGGSGSEAKKVVVPSPPPTSSSSTAAAGSPAMMLRRNSSTAAGHQKRSSSSLGKDRRNSSSNVSASPVIPSTSATFDATAATTAAAVAEVSPDAEFRATMASLLNDLNVEREERQMLTKERDDLRYDLSARVAFHISHEETARQETAVVMGENEQLKMQMKQLESRCEELQHDNTAKLGQQHQQQEQQSSLRDTLAAAAASALNNAGGLAQAAAEDRYKEEIAALRKSEDSLKAELSELRRQAKVANDSLEQETCRLLNKLDVRAMEVSQLKTELAAERDKKKPPTPPPEPVSDYSQEIAANALRIRDLVRVNESLRTQLEVSCNRERELEQERQGLRHQIEQLPIAADLKIKLLKTEIKSNFKSKFLACFSRD